MKMKKEAKDRSKYILFFTLILVILFFLSSDFADALCYNAATGKCTKGGFGGICASGAKKVATCPTPAPAAAAPSAGGGVTCTCELTATANGKSVVLDSSTNQGDDCDCQASCFDSAGKIKASCNRPDLYGWPTSVLVGFKYKLDSASHPAATFAKTNCGGAASCSKGEGTGEVGASVTVDFSSGANPDAYKTACQAQVANSQWGPTYGSKDATASRCCGSDATPSGYVTSATFSGVAGTFSYLCAEDAGRYLWVGSSNENAGKVYIIGEETLSPYDVVVRESSGFYSCKGSGAASTAAKIDAGNSVLVTKYSATHSFLCDDFARFLECKKESDSFFNAVSTSNRVYSSGSIAAVSQKNLLCYDGTWYDLATITPQTVTSRGVCEAVVGDTPSMGWIGDKDTGGAWCCFKTGQYMGNAVNGKSCWDGRVIENREIIDGTENKVINDKGKFFYCAGDAAAIAGVNPLFEGLVWGTTAGVSGGWPPKESGILSYNSEPNTARGPYFTLASSSRNYIKLPAKVDSTVTISVWGKIS